jgi:hypothetical protein
MADEYLVEAQAWIEAVLSVTVGEFHEGLKDGNYLCLLVNKLRPGTIPKVSAYKAAFRCMQNIDLFLKFAAVYGVDPADIAKAEDLFYENNLVKFALTILAVATLAQGQADVPPVSTDLAALREAATNTQKAGGKERQQDNGLGMLENNARKTQSMISSTHRQGDRMTQGSKEKSVAGGELGMLDANASSNQKMVSSSKMQGDRMTQGSKEKSVASHELGMLESNATASQKMVSESKLQGDRMTQGSKEKSVASHELGMLESNASASQKMVSDAKRSQTDNIIKTRDGAGVGGSELGMLEANASASQKMVSESKLQGDRMTQGSKEKSVASSELGMLDANAQATQRMVSENKTSGLDQIIRSTGEDL